VEGEKKERKQGLLKQGCVRPSRDEEEHGGGEVSPAPSPPQPKHP